MRVDSTSTTCSGARAACAPDAKSESGSVSGLSRLRVADVAHEVELRGADAVAGALGRVMRGWDVSPAPGAAEAGRPVSRVAAEAGGGFRFRSWWSRKPWGGIGLAGATCGLVADLTQAFCDERPGTLALHCGAVRIGGHLVALTGTYRAGKSTLVARLGAEPDLEVFGDDVLPILPDGAAWALGIEPRLRLPLPDTVSPAFRAHVARHLTVQDDRYGYLGAPTLAPRGTRAPLAAIVVLDRRAEGPASLHRVETAEAASHLIRQNIADPGEIEAFYDQVIDMAAGLCCLKLRYACLENAVAVLRAAFDSDEIPAASVPVGAPLPPDLRAVAAEPADLAACHLRSDRVIARRIGTDLFLWHVEDRNFYALNVVGAAIWLLLETPATGVDIAAALRELFPDVPGETIDRDAAALLGVLRARGLVAVV